MLLFPCGTIKYKLVVTEKGVLGGFILVPTSMEPKIKKQITNEPMRCLDTLKTVKSEELVCLWTADMGGRLGSKFMFNGVVALSPFFLRPVLNRVRRCISGFVLDLDI